MEVLAAATLLLAIVQIALRVVHQLRVSRHIRCKKTRLTLTSIVIITLLCTGDINTREMHTWYI